MYLAICGWRWDHIVSRLPSSSSSKFVKNPSAPSNAPTSFYTTHVISDTPALFNPPVSTNRRYLAFLPHSGFHNQRIAFENALVLAHMLNRTLIVPPVRLGLPIRYVDFDKLHRFHAHSSKVGLEHCPLTTEATPFTPRECIGYSEYTLLSWNAFVDLHALAQIQPLVERWDSSSGWLRRHRITERDTVYVKDYQPYYFQIYDDLDDQRPLNPKYIRRLDVDHLHNKYASYRLLHLGTLFGTTRLRLNITNNIKLRREVREGIVFTNSLLMRVAQSIRHDMDGREKGSGYVGIHLRLGDGAFQAEVQRNARLIWWRLATQVLGVDVDVARGIEAAAMEWTAPHEILDPPITPVNATPVRFPLGFPPGGSLAPLNISTISTSHPTGCHKNIRSASRPSILNTPIFIATDSKSPRTDPPLRLFLRTFSCTFFLSDFPDHLAAITSTGLVNENDGLPLGPFLMPFVDSMVAAMGHVVLGTPRSTYSSFSVDVLYRSYHDWPIVERG
ncbi:hypothetical protein BS47DRAFT_1325238 [Hydnum rufescens UP504]|uniref:O-fucosyltransferase family protein n=1 Tax=Hydnum rufescens UP504 TaxID=1448309 RepID=A0A9P6B6L5_9AGAM|nr:hypothetical protein BS47DRAFT_1325238 [Hydnum rufescens UP504]